MTFSVCRWFSIEYATFKVDAASNYYTIHVSSTGVGDAGDSFNVNSTSGVLMNGMKFSARDNDNDAWSGNCASTFGGGWWYNDCMYANLNGDLPSDSFYWHPLIDLGISSTWSLMTSRMMIVSV
jgi:hypothetical protein